MKKLALACAASVATWATGAHAWHAQGHMMVAELAWQNLTPGAKCRALGLLNAPANKEYSRGLAGSQDPGGLQPGEALFVNAASWPDRIKAQGSGFTLDGDDPRAANVVGHATENDGLPNDHFTHGYWHFADNPVPFDKSKPAPTPNALDRIVVFEAALKNPATPANIKVYDMVWLLHLIGDVHQPLHMAEQFGPKFHGGSDAGGNGVAVNGFPNLHAFWDGAPGDASGNASLRAAVLADRAGLPMPSAAVANDLDVSHWATQTYTLAVQAAYVTPIVLGEPGKPVPFTLTPAYMATAQSVARSQVALAGIRLAKVLNATLTWPAQGCPP